MMYGRNFFLIFFLLYTVNVHLFLNHCSCCRNIFLMESVYKLYLNDSKNNNQERIRKNKNRHHIVYVYAK